MHGLAELFVGHVCAARAYHLKAGVHAAHAAKIVERGNKFAAGEISAGSEDHKDARVSLRQSGTLQFLLDFSFNYRGHLLLLGMSAFQSEWTNGAFGPSLR